MTKHLTKEQIVYIREQVRDGRKKSEVALELLIHQDTVNRYIKDLKKHHNDKPYITGSTLELLQDLLKDSFVFTGDNRNRLRFLQKLFPSIKRSQFKNKSVYYPEDKNKIALQEVLRQNPSRIINYHELARVSQVFHTDLSKFEKKRFFSRNWPISRKRKYKSKQNHIYVSKEKQTILDDFLGRFLHSEVLLWFCIIYGCQNSGVKSVVFIIHSNQHS
jgi:hypothetical protein